MKKGTEERDGERGGEGGRERAREREREREIVGDRPREGEREGEERGRETIIVSSDPRLFIVVRMDKEVGLAATTIVPSSLGLASILFLFDRFLRK